MHPPFISFSVCFQVHLNQAIRIYCWQTMCHGNLYAKTSYVTDYMKKKWEGLGRLEID